VELSQDEIKDSPVKTIDRAARLMRVLAAADIGGYPLKTVAAESGLGKPTTHRLLGALIDAGFVYQDTATRRYRLGAGLSALSRLAVRQDIGALALPFIERVALETSDTAYASVREGNAAVCVGREVGTFPIRTLSLAVGDRRPLGIGSGSLAILAHMPDDEVEHVLRQNEGWISNFAGFSIDYLRQVVAETRRYGFSFVDGRILPGMNAMGVPVFDATGKVVASLSLAAVADRVKGDRIPELAAILQAQAAEVTRAIQAH
jgi:DNA-binding IclR family transcriptional regulator